MTMIYQPKYSSSRALVIGINRYKHASPLGYAVNDAEIVADVLRQRFDFPSENVRVLLDQDATGREILSAYLSYTAGSVAGDDRLLVFFAGHGLTRSGRRGEVGYLVPVDGSPGDPASLIRWDVLTRDADLIPAKHVLFVMDACYGGLALTRAVAPGAQRFLKDMLMRPARQVLTAGKADEVVADAGGPRVGHSVFTGHFLDALEGGAANPDGIISANLVMAYVYDKVAKDQQSRQTPHYGFVDGDGDFIFSHYEDTDTAGTKDIDLLIQVPSSIIPPESRRDAMTGPTLIKSLLSDPRDRIRLHDEVMAQVRATLERVSEEHFPLDATPVNGEAITERLKEYEAAMKDLLPTAILLGRWGVQENLATLADVIRRLSDSVQDRGGNVAWIALRWYPLSLLMYCTGIAALAGENYSAVATLFLTPLGRRRTGEDANAAVHRIGSGIGEADSYNVFKSVPGHERHYVPRSEYMFKAVQPFVEDQLFLGASYEDLFDRFEIFWAVAYADKSVEIEQQPWGPPGRFSWKARNSIHGGPYAEVLREAESMGEEWPPTRAGLFRGSTERFSRIGENYRASVLNRLGW